MNEYLPQDDGVIEGLKLIRLNSARIDVPDDPSYPYKLEVNLRPPELAGLVFTFLCGGTEELVVRGMTREAIDDFVKRNNLQHHPRLRRMRITGPDDLLVEFCR